MSKRILLPNYRSIRYKYEKLLSKEFRPKARAYITDLKTRVSPIFSEKVTLTRTKFCSPNSSAVSFSVKNKASITLLRITLRNGVINLEDGLSGKKKMCESKKEVLATAKAWFQHTKK